MIIADDSVVAELCAADLLGQPEHRPNSRAILLTNSHTLAKDTMAEVERQVKALPTTDITGKAWADDGK